MIAALPTWKRSENWRLSARPYTLLFAVLMLAVSPIFALRKASDWMIVYVPTAAHLWHGEDIYDQPHGYVYPPLQSLLALPVLPLPEIAQRLAWLAVNALALWAALRSAWRLAGGTDLEINPAPRREHIAFQLGLAVGLTFLFNSLMHQQTDILLAWLLFSGCEQLRDQRWNRAALRFGLAAAMKCTPLLFAPYLVLRGRYTAAALVVAVFLGANLLPDLVQKPATHATWLQKWFAVYLAPMASADHRPGEWSSAIIYNQSILGALNRWSGTTWSVDDKAAVIAPIPPVLSPTVLKASILAAAAVFGGFAFVAIWRTSKNPVAEPWHVSLVLAGMLLFSPMSSPAHFGLLLLPAFLLARAAILERHRGAAVLLSVLLLTAFAANKDLLGGTLYTLALWHGSVMLAAITAWGGAMLHLLSVPPSFAYDS